MIFQRSLHFIKSSRRIFGVSVPVLLLTACEVFSSKLSYDPDPEKIKFDGVKSIIAANDGTYLLTWDKPSSTAIEVASYRAEIVEITSSNAGLALTSDGSGAESATEGAGIVIDMPDEKFQEMEPRVLGSITGATSYSIGSLLPGNYGFRVKAIDNGGVEDENDRVLLLTVGNVTGFAGLISAEVEGKEIILNWQEFTSEIQNGQPIIYIVYEGDSSNNFVFNNPINVIQDAKQTRLSLSAESKQPGSIWRYGLRVQDPLGILDQNLNIKTVTIPTDLVEYEGCVDGVVLGSSRIQLNYNWLQGAEAMNIYRNGVLVFTEKRTSVSTFTDVGLLEGEQYEYKCESLRSGIAYTGSKILKLKTLTSNPPTFEGLAGASVLNAHAARLTWGVATGVPTAYFAVYGNPGNLVDWGQEPLKRVDANQLSVDLDGLGDDLQYAFGVRACSSSDVCDTNSRMLTGNTPDGGAPLADGAKSAVMRDGDLVVTAGWNHKSGGVLKRFVYIYCQACGNGNVGDGNGANFANYAFATPKTFLVENANNPPTELVVQGVAERKEYKIIVRDQDVHNQSSQNVDFLTINTGDLTPPSFSGITALTLGEVGTRENTLVAKFTAVASEASSLSGASHYQIYTKVGGGDSCTAGTFKSEFSALPFTAGTVYEYSITGLQPRTLYSICLKARDSSGNISTNDGFLSKSTVDETPPDFEGLQSINFVKDTGTITLGWIKSLSSDNYQYKVEIWKGTPNPTSEQILKLMDNATTYQTGRSFDRATFDFRSNDQVYALVNACDNAGFIPGGTQNCSNKPYSSAMMIQLDDVDPPTGFSGIAAENDLLTPAQGTVTISWIAPDTAYNSEYKGFKIYTVGEGLALTNIATCECTGGVCSPTFLTSCNVTGLDAFRTYTFHVRAFDAAGNMTILDPAMRSTTKRTTDTQAPAFSSNLELEFEDGMSQLKWNAAADNQYPNEPDTKLTYEVYRKVGAAFDSPLTPNTDTLAEKLVEMTDRFHNDNKDYQSGVTYFYTVCARDSAGNRTCDANVKSFQTPDLIPPVITNFATNKTPDAKTWKLTWNMSDNVAGNLLVKIYRTYSTTKDGPVSNADATIFAANNATEAPNLTGPQNQDIWVNYLLVVEDSAYNSTTATLSLLSKNKIEISDVTSSEGTTEGGKLVVIEGSGFHSSTQVKINGASCTDIQFINYERVMCYSPYGALPFGQTSNTVDVSAENSDGSSFSLNDSYTYCQDTSCVNKCNRPSSEWTAIVSGVSSTAFAGGDGSAINPYIICSKEHLNNIRALGHQKYFKMGDNVDLLSYANNTFPTIRTNNNGQYAHLTMDGDGYVVANWSYTAPPNTDFVGLFGRIPSGYKITNFGVVNSTVSGRHYVGLLAGYIDGGATCESTNLVSSGSVSGGYMVGGIFGHVGCRIIGATSSANVLGASRVGGIAGNKDYALANVYTTGNVEARGTVLGYNDQCYAGGIVGYFNSPVQTIDGAYSTGNVSCTDTHTSYGQYVGGLFGRIDYSGNLTLINSYSTGNISGRANVGGLIGSGSPFMENVYSTGNINSDGGSVGGIVGWYGNASAYIRNAYSTGEITVARPNVNAATVGGIIGYSQGVNLETSYSKSIIKAGKLVGSTFTRNGHDVGGLIGYAQENGLNTIRNSYFSGTVTGHTRVGGLVGRGRRLSIYDSYNSGDVFAEANAGGVIGGWGEGTGWSIIEIDNARSSGNVEAVGSNVGGFGGVCNISQGGAVIKNSYATGSVKGFSQVGGFCGTITGGSNTAGYDFQRNWARGAVSGTGNDVGGFVGYLESYMSINQSYSLSNVTGNDYVGGFVGRTYYQDFQIHQSYATGKVTGVTYVGGFIGYNYYSRQYNDISDCYATGEVTGSDYMGGFAGRTSDRVQRVYATGKITRLIAGFGNIGGVTAQYNVPESYPGALGGLPGTFWDKTSTGVSTTSGNQGIGLASAPMKLQTTYATWNFTDVWKMPASGNGEGYPVLMWQP